MVAQLGEQRDPARARIAMQGGVDLTAIPRYRALVPRMH